VRKEEKFNEFLVYFLKGRGKENNGRKL